MSFKTTYILFALLLGLVTVFLLSQMFGKRPEEEAAAIPALVREKVKAADIDTVEIDRYQPRKEKLVFVFDRDKKAWKMTEPFQARIVQSEVQNLVQDLVAARRLPKEKADLTANLAQHGLDPAQAKVTLHRGDKSWSLLLGHQSPGSKEGALVYAVDASLPREPMALQRSSIQPVFKEVKDFRSRDLLADHAFDLTSVKLTDPAGKELDLEMTGTSDWRFVKPDWGEAEAHGDPGAPQPPGQKKVASVTDLLEAIANIRVAGDEDFKDSESGNEASLGLDKEKPATLRIEVRRRTNSTVGNLGGTGQETEVLLIGKPADEKGTKFYARLAGDPNVVTIAKTMIQPILDTLADPAILRNRDLVKLDSNRVDAIDLVNPRTGDKTPLKLRRAGPGQPWKIGDEPNALNADSAAVEKLLTDLTAKRQVRDFPPADKKDEELGLDDKQVGTMVSLWVDGVQKAQAPTASPELKLRTNPAGETVPPTVKLLFGKEEKGATADRDLVYVKRISDKGTARLALPPVVLSKVNIGKLDFLPKDLVQLPDDQMLYLVLTRPQSLIGVRKEQSKWKLELPKTLTGRQADDGKVESLIADLRFLQANRYVTDAASDTELDRYGLKDKPELKITVGMVGPDKKARELEYVFGKETEDKAGTYALQGGSRRVFLVPPEIVKGVPHDLVDLTVFNINPDRVDKVKLTGWQKVDGKPVTLELERKSKDDWVVLNDPDYKGLDSKKVENFITSLCRLKALKFEQYRSPALAAHELEVGVGALEIQLRVKGEKEDAFILTVGALKDADKAYYAKSSTLPSDVFLLPRGLFDDVLKGRGYFRTTQPAS